MNKIKIEIKEMLERRIGKLFFNGVFHDNCLHDSFNMQIFKKYIEMKSGREIKFVQCLVDCFGIKIIFKDGKTVKIENYENIYNFQFNPNNK